MFRYRLHDADGSAAGEAHCALSDQLSEDAERLRQAQAVFERAVDDEDFPAALRAARRVIDAADCLQRTHRIAAATSSPGKRRRRKPGARHLVQGQR
jgi:hypothetical protein